MAKANYDSGIFGDLVADHDRHRALLKKLAATHGESDERKALFVEFTKEAKAHAAAEEQSLWSTVLRKPEITDDGRHAVAEHREIEKMLDDLATADMATSAWMAKFKAVMEEYLHHIGEEETELFPDVERFLDAQDQQWMAGVFERRKAAEKASAEVTPKAMKDK